MRTQLVPLCTSVTQISRPIRYVNLREFVIASRSTLRPSPRWFSPLSFPLTSLFLSFYRAWAFNVPGDPNRRRTKPLRRKYSEYRIFHERTTDSASRFNNRDGTLSRMPQSKINYIRARAIRNDSTLTSDELLVQPKEQEIYWRIAINDRASKSDWETGLICM